MSPAIGHTLLAALFVIAYSVLTALGHDGNALLALLAGQGIGASVQKVTTATD